MRTDERKITVNKGVEGNDFYITLTIQNNTNDTLRIPPSNSTIHDVLIKIPPHKEGYFIDKICIDYVLGLEPLRQSISPGSTGKIKLTVFGFLFSKKGENKIRLYPIMTTLRDKEEIRVRSNKVIVNVV